MPFVPRATKLTGDGCCAEPLWLADGSGIVYYGYAGVGGGQLGTWAVPRDGGAARPFSPHYGAFSPDRTLVAYREGGVTHIARSDGTPLGDLDTGDALLQIAPTNDRIAWQVSAPGVAQVSTSLEPPARIAVATIGPNGVGGVRVLPPIVRTEMVTWFPDGRRLAFGMRDAGGASGGIAVLDTETGSLTVIVAGLFLDSVAVAPDGRSLVYTATLQRQPTENGIWLVQADGGGRRRLDITGGYRWLPDGRGLVYVPAPAAGPTDELWLLTLADGAKRPLVTAAQARFLIAGADWALAPSGTAIVFRAANDGAIWTVRWGP